MLLGFFPRALSGHRRAGLRRTQGEAGGSTEQLANSLPFALWFSLSQSRGAPWGRACARAGRLLCPLRLAGSGGQQEKASSHVLLVCPWLSLAWHCTSWGSVHHEPALTACIVAALAVRGRGARPHSGHCCASWLQNPPAARRSLPTLLSPGEGCSEGQTAAEQP